MTDGQRTAQTVVRLERPRATRHAPSLPTDGPGAWPRVTAFVSTLALLVVVQLVVERPMLIAERFVRGAGWIEAVALAAYASWLVGRLHAVFLGVARI